MDLDMKLRIYRGSFIFQIFLFFPVFNIVGLKSGIEGRGGRNCTEVALQDVYWGFSYFVTLSLGMCMCMCMGICIAVYYGNVVKRKKIF